MHPLTRVQFLSLSLAGAVLLFPLIPAHGEAPPARDPALPKSLTPAAPLPAPVFKRDAAGTVTIEGCPADAVVCYTLDGSDPQMKSGRYLAPIALAHGGTVKARVFNQDRKQKSEATSMQYDALPGMSPLPSTLEPVTQDRSWPSYDWTKRHEDACAAEREMQPQILFIGDSINHFFTPEIFKQAYGSRKAINLGFGWDRTENVLWRLEHGELDGVSPKVAVLMIGTNNLHGNTNAEIIQGIRAICAEIHTRQPNTRILLLGIFPRGEKPGGLRDRIAEINRNISGMDGRDGVTYLDFGGKFLEMNGTISKDVMRDFLHPTESGYQIWVDAMEPTLARLLEN
jgi:lysophospholipase L1-like esterase